MISMTELEKLEHPETDAVAPEKLVDLSDVAVVGERAAERLESFLNQVSNPYDYRVGKTRVHLSFAPDAAPLADKLKAYFIGLKQQAFGVQENP